MSIHYTMTGERYETDRDGTVYHPSDDRGICDGCGDDIDFGEFFAELRLAPAPRASRKLDPEEEDDDESL